MSSPNNSLSISFPSFFFLSFLFLPFFFNKSNQINGSAPYGGSASNSRRERCPQSQPQRERLNSGGSAHTQGWERLQLSARAPKTQPRRERLKLSAGKLSPISTTAGAPKLGVIRTTQSPGEGGVVLLSGEEGNSLRSSSD